MGAVFQAHHELMDKPVALKWLRPEHSTSSQANERFVREARAAARIQHANVVQVYDVGSHDGALYMVMELLEGENFAELLARGHLSVRHALGLLLGAMHGVAAAHDHGILHRDIKPENVFIARSRAQLEGVAKILDFGVSKLMDERHGPGVTLAGQAVGTPEYMSFEQMCGAADVDERADVYAFGVLMYQALTGRTPYGGESLAAVAVQVATGTPVPPSVLRPGLPPAVEALVLKAMAHGREDRFASMRALIAAVEAALASADSTQPIAACAQSAAASTTAPHAAPPWRGGRRLTRGLVAAAGISLALGLSVNWLRSRVAQTGSTPRARTASVPGEAPERAPFLAPAPPTLAGSPATAARPVDAVATAASSTTPEKPSATKPPERRRRGSTQPTSAAAPSTQSPASTRAPAAPTAAVRAPATANGRRSGLLSNTDF